MDHGLRGQSISGEIFVSVYHFYVVPNHCEIDMGGGGGGERTHEGDRRLLPPARTELIVAIQHGPSFSFLF